MECAQVSEARARSRGSERNFLPCLLLALKQSCPINTCLHVGGCRRHFCDHIHLLIFTDIPWCVSP